MENSKSKKVDHYLIGLLLTFIFLFTFWINTSPIDDSAPLQDNDPVLETNATVTPTMNTGLGTAQKPDTAAQPLPLYVVGDRVGAFIVTSVEPFRPNYPIHIDNFIAEFSGRVSISGELHREEWCEYPNKWDQDHPLESPCQNNPDGTGVFAFYYYTLLPDEVSMVKLPKKGLVYLGNSRDDELLKMYMQDDTVSVLIESFKVIGFDGDYDYSGFQNTRVIEILSQ